MNQPKEMQLIGNQLAIVWEDGEEGFVEAARLRAASPSAATQGERDIFGTLYGGKDRADHSGVEILDWQAVGNYAIRFRFSDGHSSGLYSFELLRSLGEHG